MNRPKLILLLGASMSGKTTWAHNHLKGKFKTVRISPEEIYVMLRNHPYVTLDVQNCATMGLESMIIKFLGEGFDVILDTTTLLYQKVFMDIVSTFGEFADIRYKFFDEAINTLEFRASISKTISNKHEIRNQINRLTMLKPIILGMENAKEIQRLYPLETAMGYGEDYHI